MAEHASSIPSPLLAHPELGHLLPDPPALTFEILDGLHFELQGGILITHEHCAGMLLEGRHSPHVVHSLLDGLVQSKCLVSTRDEDHHLETRAQAGDRERAAELKVWARLLVWPAWTAVRPFYIPLSLAVLLLPCVTTQVARSVRRWAGAWGGEEAWPMALTTM